VTELIAMLLAEAASRFST